MSLVILKTLLFVCICITAIDSYSLFESNSYENTTRLKRQANCGNSQHKCASGECISEDQLCDGVEDCPDGSDETNSCANIPCASYLFQCAYGACINSDFKCDGKKNCKDNSDENKCKPSQTTSTCLPKEYQCKNGDCIDDIDLCDGIAQCKDASDESVEACQEIKCYSHNFRCTYGACINIDSRCNGIKDCVDGSDEVDCGGNTGGGGGQTAKPPVTNTPVIVTNAPPTVQNGCNAPTNVINGKWNYVEGANNIITYQCNTGFKLNTENQYSICNNGKWSNTPKCIRTCSSIPVTERLNATCDLQGSIVSCENPYDGTRAALRCASLYEDQKLSQNPYRYCSDGSWDESLPNCQPVCGLKSVDGQKLIINGTDVKKGEYPWQVAIFNGTNMLNICGGVILTPKIVLSAAHCFPIVDKSIYKVGAGKYYRNFDDKQDVNAQFSNLLELMIHSEYNNGEPFNAFDLAVLIMETPFVMKKYVIPACFDYKPDLTSLINKKGIVTGWGFTQADNAPSNTLKMLEVDYKTRETCKLPTDLNTYYVPYAPDKLCAGVQNNGQSACRGDSGGALVFPGDNGRYFIRGIVSIAPRLQSGGCDSSQFTLYTDIAYHTDYISRLISKYRS